MFDTVQTGRCRKHPAGEYPFDIALQSNLVDLYETRRVLDLGRGPRIASAWRYLECAELDGFIDRHFEVDDPPGNLVEPGEDGRRIRDSRNRRLLNGNFRGLRLIG